MVIHVIRRPARQKPASAAPAAESGVLPTAARLTRGWDDRDLRREVVGVFRGLGADPRPLDPEAHRRAHGWEDRADWEEILP